MKIVARVLMIALAVVLAGLVFIYVSPDYDIYFVRSGSMEPTLNLGDMVITGPVGGFLTEEIKTGSIITFQQDQNVYTHRVVSVKDNTITTKGDANERPDQVPVPVSKVMGVYIFKVPFIGYIVSFARSKVGWFVVILIPTAMLLGLLTKDILKEAFKADEPATARKAPNKTRVRESTNKAFPKAERPPTPVRNQNDARIREMLLEALGKVENTSDGTNARR